MLAMPGTCETCHHSTVSCTCGLSYRERLRGVTISEANFVTKDKHAYYDRGALDATFGDDRVDRYWEETEGAGALNPDGKGGFVHTDHRGNTHQATPELIDSFLGDDVDASVLA